MKPTDPADHRAVADVVRGGATRLARRLRSERPPSALPSNKISLLSHLRRHGASAWDDVLAFEPHQDVRLLALAAAELAADGLVADAGGTLAITPAGREALAADGMLRSAWLVEALAQLPAEQVELLAAAGALMTELANRPGRHSHRFAG